ncbi:hypothetical protein BDD12DRAFT_895238 [Trichophaea hybrida]|nr:hypothetical protein BDD12DRAFT_895238 [Trichophaea hybrida]
MTTLYGNYQGYQGSLRTTSGANPSSHLIDLRLSSLISTIPDIFTNKKILDVGCNNGHITVSIVDTPSGGDEGLEKVLRKTYRVLEEGGYFVLEVQGWESYAAAVKKNPRLRERKEGLKWRPEGFGEVLEGLGFVRVGRIENEGRREIGVWRKG